MFVKGNKYNRRKHLHEVYGGQMQGGISTPSNHNFIMLFTSHTGEQYGYKDGWSDEGYLYTGEGQEGDMSFIRGNLAIRDHEKHGKALHLFKYVGRGEVEYLGEMVYQDHKLVDGRDINNNARKVIVFVLREIS
jgi:5-methylcytosine-specific restriction enzyme A